MDRQHPAKINVKAVVILLVVGIGLMAGAVAGYKVRKRMVAHEALAAARTADQQADWPTARRQYRLYLSKYPDDEDALARYAEVSLAGAPRDDVPVGAAIGAYRRLLRHRPGDEDICHRLIRLYARVGDWEEVLYIGRSRLAAHAGDTYASLWQARALYALNRHDAAREAALQLVDAGADCPEAYLMLCGLVLHEDAEANLPQALDWLNRGLQRYPEAAALRTRRAWLERVGFDDLEAARQDLQRATADAGEDLDALLALGREWLDLNEPDAADDVLRRAEALPLPAHAEAATTPELLDLQRQRLRAEVYLQQGAAEAGSAWMEQVLAGASDAGRRALLPWATRLYAAAGRIEPARASLAAFTELLAGNAELASAFGEERSLLAAQVAEAAHEPYQVINALEPMVERDPDLAAGWALLARAYDQSGQRARSLQAWSRYAELKPGDLATQLHLARALRWRDPQQAVRHAVQAEHLAPDQLEPTLARVEAQFSALVQGSGGMGARTALALEVDALRGAHPQEPRLAALQAKLQSDEPAAAAQALAMLEEAIASGDNPVEAAWQLARYYRAQHEWSQGVKVCEQALAREPGSVVLIVLRAQLQDQAGQTDAACAALQQAAGKLDPPARWWAQVAHVQLLLAHEQVEAGRALFEPLTAELADAAEAETTTPSPDLIDVQLALATVARSAGWLDEGRALLESVAKAQPQQVAARLALLHWPGVAEQPERAQQLVGELKQIEGERGVQWRVAQAELWLQQGNVEQRVTQFETLLEGLARAHPELPGPVLALGEVYERTGAVAAAIALYQRSVEVEPGNLVVTSRLLSLLRQQGRFAEVDQLLRRWQQAPTALGAQRVNAALGREDYDQALFELRQRAAADPHDVSTRLVLAWWTFQLHGDLDEALRWLNEARVRAPELRAITDLEVRLRHAAGQSDTAMALLDQVVAERDDFDAYHQRAEYLTLLQRFADAERDYRHLTEFPASAGRGWAALGGFYLRRGQLDNALSACASGLQLQSGNEELQQVEVEALLTCPQADRQAQGLAKLQALRSAHPNDNTLALLQVRAWIGDGSPDSLREALALTQQVVHEEPNNRPAYALLTRLTRQLEGPEAALQVVQRAWRRNPGDPELRALRAEIELALGQTAAARADSESVMVADPQQVSARNTLTKIHLQTGELTAADALSAETADLYPRHETTQLLRADVLRAQGHADAAVQQLEAFCASPAGTNSVAARLALARLAAQRGQPTDAQRWLQEAAVLAPTSPAVFRAQVTAWTEAKDFDALTAGLHDRADDAPNGDQLYLQAAQLVVEQAGPLGQDATSWHQAEVILADAAQRWPRSRAIWLQLAQLRYVLGEYADAAAGYEQLLTIEPNHRQALNDLAWIRSEHLNDPAGGLEWADRGVARFPLDAQLRDTRGVILRRLGRLEEARHELEQGVDLAHGEPVVQARVQLHLGEVLAAAGQARAAQPYVAAARQLDEQHDLFTAEERQTLAALTDRGATGAADPGGGEQPQ